MHWSISYIHFLPYRASQKEAQIIFNYALCFTCCPYRVTHFESVPMNCTLDALFLQSSPPPPIYEVVSPATIFLCLILPPRAQSHTFPFSFGCGIIQNLYMFRSDDNALHLVACKRYPTTCGRNKKFYH